MNFLRIVDVCRLLPILLVVKGCSVVPQNLTEGSYPGQRADQLFVLIGQADSAYQRSEWEQASRLYQEVLLAVPDDPYAWFRLGNSLTHTGQYHKAIFAFENSLQHDSRQSKPWFNLSTAHLLGAQLATLRALDNMEAGDARRDQMQKRLNGLTLLLQ